MNVLSYVFDSSDTDEHVRAVLDALEARTEAVELVDVAAFDDSADARREAMLTVKSAVGIGSPPERLYDETGRPDFSVGVLVTEAETGRRTLHVGADALAALREN